MNSTRSLEMLAFDQIRTALVGLIGLTGAHLGVVILTRVIYKRARQQLAGIEALLRRLFLQMALEMEHKITPDMSETTGFYRAPGTRKPKRSWPLFQSPGSGHLPDFASMTQRNPHWQQPLVAPIIARITFLQNLLEDPDRHARRMAFQLARQRDDQYRDSSVHGCQSAPSRNGIVYAAPIAWGFAHQGDPGSPATYWSAPKAAAAHPRTLIETRLG